MVVTEVEMDSPGPLVSESSQLQDGYLPCQLSQSKNMAPSVSSLGRQSSIYSLTLDEFQRTLSGGGKNFGSMNMDEFLASIWTAEESQQHQGRALCSDEMTNSNLGNSSSVGGVMGGDASKSLSSHQSLTRQGSITLPFPLCSKTVDEVWSEIHRNGRSQLGREAVSRGSRDGGNIDSNSRQPTFGEMTLEDFLIKAGVVRESDGSMTELDHQQQAQRQTNQYAMYQGGNCTPTSNKAAGFVSDSVSPPTFTTVGGGSTVGQSGNYGGAMGLSSSYMSGPVVYEGMMGGVADIPGGNAYATDLGSLRNRKRIVDGPTEKVVEKKQRRMIKNRESAARSRARKQAYTVELETELNLLKEENKQLKQALVELERKRRLQCVEQIRLKEPIRAKKTREKFISIRRNMSCPL